GASQIQKASVKMAAITAAASSNFSLRVSFALLTRRTKNRAAALLFERLPLTPSPTADRPPSSRARAAPVHGSGRGRRRRCSQLPPRRRRGWPTPSPDFDTHFEG